DPWHSARPIVHQQVSGPFLGFYHQHVCRERHAPGAESSFDRHMGESSKDPLHDSFPLILLFCLIGVYSLNANVTEIFIMLIFGMLGFLMRRGGFEGAPFILAMVLRPIMETSLRQSLLISRGSFSALFSRPIFAVLMILSV